ncbi:glycoside hydrolase [Cladorrhinum sp. PSN259]|nr:glycoside hydrolase [Cladorrhinum sp. PSN259]
MTSILLGIIFLYTLVPHVHAHNSSWSTWGPYRPNLYLGVRPLIPKTLLMGVMWASGDDRPKMLRTLRDTCEQNDGMQGYGWSFYDTRVGGSQLIHDEKLEIDLTTDFLKSADGASWAVRVRGAPRSRSSNVKTSVIFHVTVEEEGKVIICEDGTRGSNESEAFCRGKLSALGNFEFKVLADQENKALHDTAMNSLQVSEDMLWQAKSVFINRVRAADGSRASNVAVEHKPGGGNMHFIQMTFQGPFTAIFTYNSNGKSPLDREGVYLGLRELQSTLPTNVNKAFPRASPFKGAEYGRFTQEALSNLLGGLGFFHGDAKVDYTHAPEYEETEPDFWVKAASAMTKATITNTKPLTLLSHIPSRPFFPRGFLWDEGFHLLPVIEWDLDLAISVLQSWLDIMDDNGWIAREQILGPEARSKVPREFQVQYPHYANPPTLIALVMPAIFFKLTKVSPYYGHPSTHLNSPKPLLKALYPLLGKHYNWFRRTQSGSIPNTYRWRGRTPTHTLTSGLDDYPRPQPPSPSEIHLDALAWVGGSALALLQLSNYLNVTTDTSIYSSHLKAIHRNLDKLHWDQASQTYCDATLSPSHTLTCHEGYLSLFLLFLGLVQPTHPNFPSILDSVERLLTPYGIRSLSALDSGYGRGDNYWRGAVWMNLNVLAVLQLHKIGTEPPHITTRSEVQKRVLTLGKELREQIVETVYKSWQETGFFWEQYDDKTGQGKGSRGFTGWTACVVLIMGLEFATSICQQKILE